MAALDQGWHLLPTDDLYPHRKALDCWCIPERHEDSDVWLHNAKDGRERYEDGRALN